MRPVPSNSNEDSVRVQSPPGAYIGAGSSATEKYGTSAS